MPQISNPYGFKLISGKESNFSAGIQPFYIKSGYSVQDAAWAEEEGYSQPSGIGSGDPVAFTFRSDGAADGYIGLASEPWGNKPDNVKSGKVSSSYDTLAGGGLIGIFGGCSYQSDQQGQPLTRSAMWKNKTENKGKTPALATVQDHSFLVWQVQTNGAFYTDYVKENATPIGQNYNFTYGAGVNPATGQSRAQLFVSNNIAAPHYSITQKGGVSSDTTQYCFFKIVGLAPTQNNKWTDDYVDVLVVINDHYLKPGTSSVLLSAAKS